MHQIFSYIKFIINSKNQHGVHSPFIYDLVTKCFYDKTNYSEYKALETFRSELLKNQEIITITDFGSGSKVFRSDKRRINAIAKTSATTLKNTKLLFRLVKYFKPASILELGTNLGMGTYACSLGNPTAEITTIEGCESILKVAQQQFSNKKVSTINTIQGHFKEELHKLNQRKWNLIFFDGHHSREATLHYFDMLLPTANNDSIFIFDDIYWSEGMTQAWQIIKQHPQVTVTVDIFNWGIVFFRQEQLKEHFKIRV